MSLLDALSTLVGSGALSGLVSGIAAVTAKLYEKRLDQAQERARWGHEAELHRLNAERDRYLADQNLLIESDRLSGERMTSAIEADAREAIGAYTLDGMPWQVGAIRTLTRPALTLLAVLLVAVLWATAEEAPLRELIVSAVLGLCMSAFAFWFGGRVVSTTDGR